MRITEQIFMGNGDQSLAKIGYCYQLLSQAFTILGGIQQPPNPCEEDGLRWQDWEGTIKDGQNDVLSIAKELFVALTGTKVVKTKEN